MLSNVYSTRQILKKEITGLHFKKDKNTRQIYFCLAKKPNFLLSPLLFESNLKKTFFNKNGPNTN